MNDKVKKKLDRILTVITVLSIVLCLSLCIQVIQGKSAGLFGFRIFHILTGSMEPTIPTNSNVIVKSVDTDTLQVGDIITFISKDEAIYGNANTHRIIEVVIAEDGSRSFATRGDANNAADSLLVYPEDVIGKVVFHMSPSISLFLGFLHTKLGFVTVILLPLMFIIWLLMKDFKKGVNEYMDSTAQQQVAAEFAGEMPAGEGAAVISADSVGIAAMPDVTGQSGITETAALGDGNEAPAVTTVVSGMQTAEGAAAAADGFMSFEEWLKMQMPGVQFDPAMLQQMQSVNTQDTAEKAEN